jgi:large-conductance mechanosensitive channel
MLIAPILVIVLGGLDFAKASLQSDEDAIKKAGINFGKRLIAAVLLFLLPLIINIVLEIAFDAGVLESIPEICIDN